MMLMSDMRPRLNVKAPMKKWERRPVGPALPSAQVLLRESHKLSDELNQLAVDLNCLLHEKQQVVSESQKQIEVRKRPHRIDEYQGFLFSRDLFDDFRNTNRAKVQRSHRRFTVQTHITLDNIEELPQYEKVLHTHYEFLPAMFTTTYWRSALVQEQKMIYALHYVELWKVWRNEVMPAVDTLNLKFHIDMRDDWGEEQPEAKPTVPIEGPLAVVGCAPDVEMRLSIELPAYNDYVNNNAFVEDPLREHLWYKRRLYWTSEERELFFQLFRKHPHKFAKIAESFPNKTGKDMIEFYYLVKTSEEMSAAKALKNRRGGSRTKKVVAEGKVGRK